MVVHVLISIITSPKAYIEFSYWQHDLFNLDDLYQNECKAEFCFLKNDIYPLKDVSQVPQCNAVAWGGAGGARAPPIKISRRSIPPDSLKLRDFGARGGPPQ